MKKTWRNIIITSLVLVIVEISITLLLLHPYYKAQVVYNSIDDGNWIETQENYEKLSDSQKERVQGYLFDFAAWEARQYAIGKIEYEKIAAIFDAVNAIDETGTIYNQFMPNINKNEYVKALEGLYDAEMSIDNNAVYECRNTINAVSLRLDNNSREELMIAVLTNKYQEFLNEQIGPENVQCMISIVTTNSIYQAYDYANVISNNVDKVLEYRAVYENAKVKLEEEDYFAVIDMCKNLQVDTNDTIYQGLISELYTQAYETGKTYYLGKLDTLVIQGEKEAAVNLMADIQARYGDDVDVSDVKADLAEDWQKEYIKFVEQWENNLKLSLEEFETGEYILEHQYDNLRPNSILLYDVDNNSIPELFLFKSENINNIYVECYMYGYIEDKCRFLGYVNLMKFCTTSEMVAFPENFERESGEECQLVQFDGEELSFETKCQKIEDVYYVDGYQVSDADYLSAQSQVLANISQDAITNLKNSTLEDAEKYILAY